MSVDRLVQQRAEAPRSKNLQEVEELSPPAPAPTAPPAPPAPPPLSRHVMSASTSGNQSWSRKQQRPSVLRQVPASSLHPGGSPGRSPPPSRLRWAPKRLLPPLHPESVLVVSSCKEEQDVSCVLRSSSPQTGSSSRQSLHQLRPPRRDSPTQPHSEDREAGVPEDSSLSMSGLCCWPGCDAASEDFPSFLEHLQAEHGRCERSLVQWRVQQDLVHGLETQLILEKQKLFAMQLHLRLSETSHPDWKTSSDGSHSLPLFSPHTAVTNSNGGQPWLIRRVNHHGFRAEASAHFLPDLVQSLDCYQHANIRPPYTYAYMIRWAIMESPERQRTLNEIYNWFTTKFFYFRNNTATWKNAVRHNLSLHKCFVRVEGGKGAVWTVDETEFQRRKGQKYHRDCPVKWFKYPYFCPEES